MNQPRKFVAGGIFLGLVLVFVIVGRKQREPVYEGRTLSSWLDHHVGSSAAIPPYGSEGWKKADEAIRAIGTNSIPTLLAMLRAKDPPGIVSKFAPRGWRGLTAGAVEGRREEVEYAFRILGTNGAAAVPELVRIYEAPPSASSQMYATLSLQNIGRPAKAALPALIRRFSDTNDQVRFYAVSAVAQIGGDPTIVLPALRTALKDPYVSTRWNALSGLIGLGALADAAIPDIEKMVDDPGMVGSTSITQQVQTALWRLAPQKAGKALVIETNTPAIAGNKTVAAIKMVFMGERKVLIPAGKNVPAYGQYWDSNPGPKLTLYRTTQDGTDHLLGHFEVMDIPKSENVNVSTLCIVADGKIFLNARDSHTERFLNIRRVEE